MTIDPRVRFDADADAYARLWAPVLRPHATALLPPLPLGDAEVVLEVGCGTGGVLDQLVASAPRARVVGLDASFGMLRRSGHRGRVVQADARRLAVADRVADVAVLAFMLQHLPDPGRAVAELGRVVRPGGALGLAAWGSEPPWRAAKVLAETYDAHGAPPPASSRLGATLTDTPEKLGALLDAAGFALQRTTSAPLGWEPTVDELVDQASAMGSNRARYDALDADARSAFTSDARRRLAALPAADLRHPGVVLRLWAVRR